MLCCISFCVSLKVYTGGLRSLISHLSHFFVFPTIHDVCEFLCLFIFAFKLSSMALTVVRIFSWMFMRFWCDFYMGVFPLGPSVVSVVLKMRV